MLHNMMVEHRMTNGERESESFYDIVDEEQHKEDENIIDSIEEALNNDLDVEVSTCIEQQISIFLS